MYRRIRTIMLNTFNLRLSMFIVLFTIQVICDSKSVSRDTTKLTRVLEIVEEDKSTRQDETASNSLCDQLPQLVLAELLGEVYNPRYMSVNWPVESDDIVFRNIAEGNRGAYTHFKRDARDDQTSFYVEDTYIAEISDKPAWEVNHALVTESKTKRRRRRSAAAIEAVLSPDSERPSDEQTSSLLSEIQQAEHQHRQPQQQQQQHWQQMVGHNFNNSISSSNKIYSDEDGMSNDGARENFPVRNKRAYRPSKSLPWTCEQSIEWIDLGADYFPRWLRTVTCTKRSCFHGMYVCKAKSFAIKVLRRHPGMCADASNLRRQSIFNFRGEYGEVWRWEEHGITVCCDCGIA